MIYILLLAAIVEACTFAAFRVERSGKIAAQLALSEYQTKQRDYISQLVVAGTQAAAAADLQQKELANERDTALAKWTQLARSLPTRSNPVDSGAIKLLDAAISASAGKDAAIAAPKPEPNPSTLTTDTGDWVDWSLTVIDDYSACRDQVIGFQSFYKQLQSAQQ